MKGLRFLLAAVVMMAAAAGARGQGFEWVKAYSGSNITGNTNTNEIKGSFVDTQGNTYILGNVSPRGRILGVDLLPQGVYQSRYNNQAVVVAKISADGQLVWHKPIYASSGHCYAYSLCNMGDTAFIVMCGIPIRHYFQNGFLYYLDTLLTSSDSGYLTEWRNSFCHEVSTSFITFNLDGDVLEQHVLELGYIDNNGNPVTYGFRNPRAQAASLDALYSFAMSTEIFTIDHDGNIYIIRLANDAVTILPSRDSSYTISIRDGSIGALKIMIDGRRSLIYHLDMPSPRWNQQLLKFSPHFDSLIGGVYMFDSTYRNLTRPEAGGINSMSVDLNNNVYFNIQTVDFPIPPSGRFDIYNSDSLSFEVRGLGDCFLIKYNSDLRATGLVQMTSDDTLPSTWARVLNHCFDFETNSLFVQGSVGWATRPQNILYRGDTIRVPQNNTGLWLRLDIDSLNLLSYGLARPLAGGYRAGIAHTAARKNRVFSLVGFSGIEFADTTLANSLGTDKGFAVWDYDGHELMIENFNVTNLDNLNSGVHIVDSAVYLTGTLHEDATFGDITLQGTGNSQAYVAKYVDTAFMRPYVHYENRTPQTIAWQQGLTHRLGEGRVALTATSTSGLPVGYRSNNNSVAYMSGDTLVLVAAGDVTVTARQNGNPQYEPARPVSRTFHIEPSEPQSITWTQELEHRLAEGHVALTATATSGLPVSYSCGDNGVAQVRGDTLVLLAAGDATVTARQEGDAQYAAAEPVSRTFHIEAPEPQSITWTQELDLSLAEGRVVLTATATSGLPVSYSCSNSGVAQVRGDTLVLLATGTATVTARQEGDARYAAAEPVSKTLRVSAEGIGEAAAEGLTIYPNPTTGVVQVRCDGCTVKEATVISALGRREHVACRDGRIDLSHLAAGVYYLEVRTDTGVAREKVTKL